MPTLINLTPHLLSLQREDGTTLVLPPSGEVARVSETREDAGRLPVVGGFLRLTRPVMGRVTGLPGQVEGTTLVVSRMVLKAVREQQPTRDDLISPGPLVRDEKGVVVGADGGTVLP